MSGQHTWLGVDDAELDQHTAQENACNPLKCGLSGEGKRKGKKRRREGGIQGEKAKEKHLVMYGIMASNIIPYRQEMKLS